VVPVAQAEGAAVAGCAEVRAVASGQVDWEAEAVAAVREE